MSAENTPIVFGAGQAGEIHEQGDLSGGRNAGNEDIEVGLESTQSS